ncbi:hypothetical protein MNBD_GAMMA01-711 [hydrothermal vent metagenome]|uniref:Uncharacterized protein n=1 Tax=hydrothermal vent metagenome TaxID=652676 RepID=A0A3B0VSW0_9ZZZZ
MGLEKLNKLLSYMAYRIFRPLVVLFLRNSIPYKTASDWLKRVYIDTAFDNTEFRINPDKKQTKTRVAILTGLSRVEIDRILKIEKPLEVTEQTWNRATKVLSGWCNDSDYLDSNRKPVKLPVYGDLSFSSLVEKYSGGATMRSVLDELENVKSVETSHDVVRLIRQDYSSKPDKQQLLNLELYGTSAGELLNTLVFNDSELNEENKRFQKMVFAWEIPDLNKQEAMDFIYSETDKLLISIDNKLSMLNDKPYAQTTYQLGLGTYYFEEKNNETAKII